MKIPKIEYEVYYPLYNNSLIKLSLSLCQHAKVEITIPVKSNDILDIYNMSSDYYNNICYKTESESGIDISLKKRRENFIKNNMSLCEENCELIEYNIAEEKVKCFCDIKLSINYDNKFNKEELYKNFNDIKNNNILKCFKIVWKIKNLINNYGFFIILFMLILYFITLFIFWFKSFDKILQGINYINFFLRKEIVKTGDEKISRIKNNKKRLKPIENKNINNIKSENEIKIGIFSEQILQSADCKIIKIEIENNFGLEGLNDIYIFKNF